MKTITYKFNDGTICEVEVSEELFVVHEQLVAEEKKNNKRETRRHISLNYLNEYGIDFEAPDCEPHAEFVKSENESQLYDALAHLSDKQRALVEKVFYGEMSLREIAKQMGVSHQALSQQMATIFKKLKKLL